MEGGELKEEELWKNTDSTVRFNTPVLKDGTMFGLSTNNALFCINTDTHETAWTQPLGGASRRAADRLGRAGAVADLVGRAVSAAARSSERPAGRGNQRCVVVLLTDGPVCGDDGRTGCRRAEPPAEGQTHQRGGR